MKKEWLFIQIVLFLISCNSDPTGTGEIYYDARTIVSQHGITWYIEEEVEVKQFINGDYYIVGPFTVLGVDPLSANGRNGSVKNIPAVNNRSGFDNRISYGYYDETLVAVFPLEMNPGDIFAVISDGIFEATDQDKTLFGTDRVSELLTREKGASPSKIIDVIRQEVLAFTNNEPADDDRTMIILKRQ